MSKQISRRDFVAATGTIAAGAMIVPRHVLGMGYQAPSATLNIAVVGAGGMGASNMAQLLSENIVAICDVDMPLVERGLAGRLRSTNENALKQAQAWEAAYKKAAKYTDFREMLDKQKDIDAVVIATPDHTHAAIAIRAMKMGKHVYVQKPMAWSVYESRLMAKVAAEQKVVTQMGNQGHSMEGTRRVREIVQSGVLGPISETHIWTDRPVRYWAQGIPRPAPLPAPAANAAASTVPPRWNMRTVEQAVLKEMAANPQSPPPGLDWNLFLGPVADMAYHPSYHPFSWRGWVDFGGGALGDMGAHLVDQPFWALDLDFPTTISASSSPWGGPADNPATFPLAVTVQYEFAARGNRPPVKMFWYDGGLMPARPNFLPDDITLPRGDGGGGVFIGTKGILTYETYGNNPKVYPEATAAAAAAVPQTVERITTSHEMNWANACKGEGKASSSFDYAARLNETMLLGMAALRGGQGRKFKYDAAAMSFTNAPEVNQYLTRVYRQGWEL
jgi:predicted dehydrogenase